MTDRLVPMLIIGAVVWIAHLALFLAELLSRRRKSSSRLRLAVRATRRFGIVFTALAALSVVAGQLAVP